MWVRDQGHTDAGRIVYMSPYRPRRVLAAILRIDAVSVVPIATCDGGLPIATSTRLRHRRREKAETYAICRSGRQARETVLECKTVSLAPRPEATVRFHQYYHEVRLDVPVAPDEVAACPSSAIHSGPTMLGLW